MTKGVSRAGGRVFVSCTFLSLPNQTMEDSYTSSPAVEPLPFGPSVARQMRAKLYFYTLRKLREESSVLIQQR